MSDSFDINFKPLPPRLQLHLWILALDADTSRVNLAYQADHLRTGLAYNYGGNAEAFLTTRRFSTTFGVNPSNGNMDLGLVYRGFRFGASGKISEQSAGFNFGYGAPLLPMELHRKHWPGWEGETEVRQMFGPGDFGPRCK